MTIRILAVDDEPLNIDIMQEYFEEANFQSIATTNGQEALDILKNDSNFDVIVLDRMMPKMDGMQFLKEFKKDNSINEIPVVMQTAASADFQIVEGIKSGVYYYLSKPYTKEVFLSIIHAANDDFAAKRNLKAEVNEYSLALSKIEQAEFKFKTLEEAKALAILIGSSALEGNGVIVGLKELMINAIEHGNLGISYDEKKALKLAGTWCTEIEKRLAQPQFSAKNVTLNLSQNNGLMHLTIEDMGSGFDWKEYLEPAPERLTDPNGRGIMISNNCGFNNFEYRGKGNVVECSFQLKKY